MCIQHSRVCILKMFKEGACSSLMKPLRSRNSHKHSVLSHVRKQEYSSFMTTSILARDLARLVAILISLNFFLAAVSQAAETQLRVLFLGDNGHHRPADRFKQLQPVLADKGIEAIYTDDLADLNPARLAGFDCLIVFANHTRIAPEQEAALLDFVARGGGFVPLHC